MGIQAEGFLLPSILKGNNSIISGNTTFTVRPTFGTSVPWDSGNQPVQVIGQCRLYWTSNTVCTLLPYNGNQLFINGAYYTIPTTGVTINNTGMTASTLYYVYASMSANTMVLTGSLTGHSTSPVYGHETMTGNTVTTLVGMVYHAGDSRFYDTTSLRLTASYFNRRRKSLFASYAQPSTSSTSWVELSTALRVNFVNWADDAVSLASQGYLTSAQTGAGQYLGIGVNGNFSSIYVADNVPNGSGYAVPATVSGAFMLGEGFNYGTPMGTIGSGTGSYSIGMMGEVNQ